MTEIINDNIDVNMTIAGNPWLVVEATVELSHMTTPNYVKMKIIPHPDKTAPNLPAPIDDLVGAPFELHVDNQLISKRDTNATEETLLFKGNLANISTTGENFFEAIAYDPGQQAFEDQNSGSVLNQYIYIPMPGYPHSTEFNGYAIGAGTQYLSRTIEAKKLVRRIVDRLGLPSSKVDIQLKDGGVTRSGEGGSITGAYNRLLYFEESFPKIGDALEKARKRTESEYWFSKDGTFHFGLPNPTKHNLHFITEASDGKTTPPYQSVRVIGSGAASQEGWSRANMTMEDRIVVEAAIADPKGKDGLIANIGETKEPVFVYRNAEISTQQQAKSVAKSLIKDLGKQQSSGTVTVTGFPEVVPLDAIRMPQAQSPDGENYHENQPMGGATYSVYKVTHKLNNSDGFKTEIEVGGLVGVTRAVVTKTQAHTAYNVNEYVGRLGRGPAGYGLRQ